MRILHIVYSFINGGIETMLVNVANKQTAEHEVYIMIVNNIVDEDLINRLDKKVKIIRIKRDIKRKYDIRLLLIGIYAFYLSPDIIHLHDLSIARFLFIRRKKCKLVATKHNTNEVDTNNIFLNKINGVIAISESVMDVLNRNKLLSSRSYLCYNGVDFSKIEQRRHYSSKMSRIISIGRIDFAVKGQNIIIEAISELRSRGYSFVLEIWGDGVDIQHARDMVSKYDLSDSVIIKGDVNHHYVEQHLKDYDLFIQASNKEGFGLTAIEAIGAGLPCILSDVEGHKEIARRLYSISLFMSRDTNSLVESVIRICNDWNNVTSACVENSRLVRKEYSIEKMVKNLNDIYKQV